MYTTILPHLTTVSWIGYGQLTQEQLTKRQMVLLGISSEDSGESYFKEFLWS